jgi:RNA-directed DNA polymerase
MLLEAASRALRMDPDFIQAIATSANHLYKVYQIPKKSGGVRTIEHPAKRLKLLQRWLARRILPGLPIHPAATAYRPQKGIRENAIVHLENRFIMNLDFENFFGSIRDRDIARVIRANRLLLPMEEEDIVLLNLIVCRQGTLVIGAPSSPTISNIVMNEFDGFWSEQLGRRGVAYTRYADDITLSTNTPRVLGNVLADMRRFLETNLSPRLRLNEEKIRFGSKKYGRRVTGLILADQGRLSIGRRQKRYIRSLVHKYLLGNLPENQLDYLKGYIAFASHIEADLVDKLSSKYGWKTVLGLIGPTLAAPQLAKEIVRLDG